MKTCPICRRQYVDDMSFCLEDGTRLPVDEPSDKITERPTEEYGAETLVRQGDAPQTADNISPHYVSPQAAASSNRTGFFVVAAFLLVGVLTLLGAGIAGVWLYSSTKNDIALADNTNADANNSNSNSGTNTTDIFGSNANNSNRNPTPSPDSTTLKPTPSPTKDPKSTPDPYKVILDDPPFPTPIKPPVPKQISGGILNGKATSLPRPPYPPAARAVGASGSVTVQVLVDERGNVVSASAVSGHPLLRSAAVAAARGARFQPTMLSGQPVKVSGVITYNFSP